MWIGAVATLSGTLLGGAISFVLNGQQMKDARAQRAEQALLDRHQRSLDRRFSAYSDFYTQVRLFRNALRTGDRPAPSLPIDAISALARAAHNSSSLVFLTVEDPGTRAACADLVRTMSGIQGVLDDSTTTVEAKPWPELNELMAAAARRFETAARDELEVDPETAR